MRIDLHRAFDDHDPVYLGTVAIRPEAMMSLTDEFVDELVEEEWQAFVLTKGEETEDSRFISYLVRRNPHIFMQADGNRQINLW